MIDGDDNPVDCGKNIPITEGKKIKKNNNSWIIDKIAVKKIVSV